MARLARGASLLAVGLYWRGIEAAATAAGACAAWIASRNIAWAQRDLAWAEACGRWAAVARAHRGIEHGRG